MDWEIISFIIKLEKKIIYQKWISNIYCQIIKGKKKVKNCMYSDKTTFQVPELFKN